MNKKDLLIILEESREKFLDAIDSLDDERFFEPVSPSGSSLKDILVHLCMWEAQLVTLMWQAKRGQKPTTVHFSGKSVDEINADWSKHASNRPLDLVIADFQGVRNQTILRVEEFAERDLTDPQRYPWLGDSPLWKWIAENSYEHEAEHLPEIHRWLERKESD